LLPHGVYLFLDVDVVYVGGQSRPNPKLCQPAAVLTEPLMGCNRQLVWQGFAICMLLEDR
jgi:hypothetical protein